MFSFDDGQGESVDTSEKLGRKQPSITTTSTPKTFRAETLGTDEQREEVVRKLSTSSRLGEFRPITGQASETSLSSQDSEFNKVSLSIVVNGRASSCIELSYMKSLLCCNRYLIVNTTITVITFHQ